ncbi:MAG: 7-cyano-7-deazaguanine synthase QueC [Planctomycetota bacterium]|jgi:7-cyano-7-deazaguanine synthase
MSDGRAAAGRPAVVLVSGGLDSATTLAGAVAAGYDCHALSFDYGQRHKGELHAAARVAQSLGAVEHHVMTIDLRAFGGSALTADIEVPKDRTDDAIAHGIPVTYVPARNTIFLAFALGKAEVLDAHDIFIGVNAVDYSGYPDCRPEFVAAFERVANLATRMGVESDPGNGLRIHAPLIDMTKAEIIRHGVELGVDYGLTISCYDPDEDDRACGACDACHLRAAGFQGAGVVDPGA